MTVGIRRLLLLCYGVAMPVTRLRILDHLAWKRSEDLLAVMATTTELEAKFPKRQRAVQVSRPIIIGWFLMKLTWVLPLYENRAGAISQRCLR